MTADELWRAHLRQVGEFIRAQRQLADLSQRELARLTEISDAYMSQLERGLHEPSIRVLRSLADGLGVGRDQFIAFAAGLADAPARVTEASTEEAIKADPRLSDGEKRALLGVLRSYVDAGAGDHGGHANEAGGTGEAGEAGGAGPEPAEADEGGDGVGPTPTGDASSAEA